MNIESNTNAKTIKVLETPGIILTIDFNELVRDNGQSDALYMVRELAKYFGDK